MTRPAPTSAPTSNSPTYVFHNSKFDIRALESIGVPWGEYTHSPPGSPCPSLQRPHALTIAIDTETTGLDIKHGCRPFFISTCDSEGQIRCWEFDVNPLTRLPIVPKEKLAQVKQYLSKGGWDHTEDTLIGSHVLNSSEPHGLKALALKYLDVPEDDLDALKVAITAARKIAKRLKWRIADEDDPHFPGIRKPKDGWWVCDMWLPRAVAKHLKYPANHKWWTVLATYGSQDAERTIALWQMQKEGLSDLHLWSQYNRRRQLLPITYRCDTHGLTVDVAVLASTQADFDQRSAQARDYCLSQAKIANLASPKQLQDVLFNQFKLKPVRATKVGYSTDNDTLDALKLAVGPDSKYFKFIDNLQLARKYAKAIEYQDTYARVAIALPNNPLAPKRRFAQLFPSSNITGTKTTRFSYSDPNAQQISKQEATNCRRVFGPYPGREWWSLDYDNQELRIFAYASGDKTLIKAFEDGYSVHLIFCQILHPELFKQCQKDGVDFKDRYKATFYQWAKNGTFALIYGAAPRKANATYRVSDGYDRIRNRLPLIDKFIATRSDEARKHGYITTLGGYRIEVPQSEPYKAANYFIQGSAGEAMQLAMIRVAHYLDTLSDGYKMILNVHDELVFDFPRSPVPNNAKISVIRRLMEQSGEDFSIPFPVSVDRIRSNWAEECKVVA